MVEGAEQAAPAIHRQIARRPNGWSADIARKDCVLGGQLVENSDHILRMNRLLAWTTARQLIQALPGFLVVFERSLQMLAVFVPVQPGEEGSESLLGVAHKAIVNLGATTQLLPPDVNLDDGRILRKELLIGKVRSEHQQQIAVHHRVIAGGKSQEAGHPHVERVVILDEFLGSHRVHDGGFQPARQLNQLRVRARAARSAKNGDLL